MEEAKFVRVGGDLLFQGDGLLAHFDDGSTLAIPHPIHAWVSTDSPDVKMGVYHPAGEGGWRHGFSIHPGVTTRRLVEVMVENLLNRLRLHVDGLADEPLVVEG